MAQFVKGDIVVVPFPFSTTSGEKPRPALVLASWPCERTTDYILYMISSQNIAEPFILELLETDIENGSLHVTSYVRPSYLFTIAEHRITKKVANLKVNKLNEVREKLRNILCD